MIQSLLVIQYIAYFEPYMYVFIHEVQTIHIVQIGQWKFANIWEQSNWNALQDP